MTAPIKQCRVCGDPMETHRLSFRDCIVEAYNLSPEWPGDYKAYLLLCIKNDYLSSYGGSAGIGPTTLWFKHMPEKIITGNPTKDMAYIILSDLAPQSPKGGRQFVAGIESPEAPIEIDDIVPIKKGKSKKETD